MNWQELMHFFCRGAYQTWANNAPPQSSPLFPGAKIYIYTEGDLKYIDIFYANKAGSSAEYSFSGGQTALVYFDSPLWQFSYDGWHLRQDGVKEFLKEALCVNYSQEIFIGGRGPSHYQPEGSRFVYENLSHKLPTIPKSYVDIIPSPGYRAFAGEDLILDSECLSDTKVYCHQYRGKALVEKLP